MVRIHYELPEDLHRAAKATAARQGISLKEFIIRAMERAVAEGGAVRDQSADHP